MLPPPVRQKLEKELGAEPEQARPVSGGDINQAYQFSCQGKTYFLKLNDVLNSPDLFEAEADGLTAIAALGIIEAPLPILKATAGAYSFLLLPFIEKGYASTSFWERFGVQLAQLHQADQSHFGWHRNNYIGTLPQVNTLHTDWATFYIEQRLHPQVEQALQKALLSSSDEASFQQLFQKLDRLLPEEPPSLLHGDLWSGNYLTHPEGYPVLIDPAVYAGHREVDLAMTLLFGGFAPAFYEAYQATYPLLPGFDERKDLYQLYYLLVHLNLFGRSYLASVRHILHYFTK
jgi:protein-ribulosamine 3-kinase